jgi:hypothetical protein
VHRNCKQDLSLGGYTSRTAWAGKKDLSLGGYTSRTAWAAKRLCIEKKGNKS